MIGQKRFQNFTLGRAPFFVFFAAGISGITLSPLFQGRMASVAVLAISFAIMLTSLVARFRDVGLSAWLAPFGLFPGIALLVGFAPGDGGGGPEADAGHSYLHSLLFTLMCSGISVAWLVN